MYVSVVNIPPNPHRPQRSPLPFILGGAGAFVFLLAAGGTIASGKVLTGRHPFVPGKEA